MSLNFDFARITLKVVKTIITVPVSVGFIVRACDETTLLAPNRVPGLARIFV